LDDFMKPPGVRNNQKTPVLETLPKREAYGTITRINDSRGFTRVLRAVW